MYEEEFGNENKYNDSEMIEWYFKSSNRNDDWNLFDIKTQQKIEKCYKKNETRQMIFHNAKGNSVQ